MSRTSVSWRRWGDVAAAAGVLMAVLLLARGARPFIFDVALMVAGADASLPQHALVWARFGLPAAIVLTGLLGWWVVAAALGWVAVAVEVVLLNPNGDYPGAAAMLGLIVILAVLLSVPGGFRRGRAILGTRGLAILTGGAVLIGCAPVAEVLLGDVAEGGGTPGAFSPLFVIESRLGTAITVAQYAIVAITLLAVVVTVPRWRKAQHPT